MKIPILTLLVHILFALLISLHVSGQEVQTNLDTIHSDKDTIPEITKDLIEHNQVYISLTKQQFSGIRLDNLNTAKIINIDDPSFANLEFDDSKWNRLVNPSEDSFDIQRIYWCRVKFRLHPDLANQPLALHLYWLGAMEVYLNGQLVYSFGIIKEKNIQDDIQVPMRVITLNFNGSNTNQLLAIRFGQHSNFGNLKGADILPANPTMELTLHTLETSKFIDIARVNIVLLYGFFLGTNCIIMLLAIFQLNRRKGNKTWLLFGLFTFFTGFVAFTNFLGRGVFNITTDCVLIITIFNYLAYVLSVYFLLLVMRNQFDKENKKTSWIYTVLMLLMVLAFYGSVIFKKDYYSLNLALLIISLFELLRLSLLAVKYRVYGSWIIVTGALIFIMAGPILEQFYNALHLPRPYSVTLLLRFSFYLSMPVSLSIFLAIQTSRNNKLLARQRNELDLEVQERTHQLLLEKKKSDDLLLNILPAEVAEELKQTGTTRARDFDNVTVMFTDFKNFTVFSEQLAAQELVNEINYCYSAFDNIISKYGIEKIKTMGDSYMCAGGLPIPNSTHAEDIVKAALEISEFMAIRKAKSINQKSGIFEIRIGIHSGPVVAGIVGIKKFAYDIWGDTVNIASRMESSAEVGKVNISGSTYELVKDKFNCTHRGKISVKHKGEIDMYFVESVK